MTIWSKRPPRPVVGALVVGAAAAMALTACGSFHSEPKVFRTVLPGSTSAPGISGLAGAGGHIEPGSSISPFDDRHPAVANLDPGLRDALQRAAEDASAADVHLMVNSGWRSAEYQQSLLDDAVRIYGSRDEARRWVNTPERSTHVTGDAVDIGPTDASSWLSQHGSDYGLCQTYANEMWHFELAVAPGETCPSQIADPATD